MKDTPTHWWTHTYRCNISSASLHLWSYTIVELFCHHFSVMNCHVDTSFRYVLSYVESLTGVIFGTICLLMDQCNINWSDHCEYENRLRQIPDCMLLLACNRQPYPCEQRRSADELVHTTPEQSLYHIFEFLQAAVLLSWELQWVSLQLQFFHPATAKKK